MDDMLESLLDMARLDSGTWPVEPETFALNPLLERLTTESLAEAEAAGLRLRFCPTLAAIHTDRRLLERILRNFIGNALRWTERGGVVIGVRPRGNHWRIDVVDSGAGIPREKWRVIFQAFHQLGAPARTASKGLGLGLAVVDRAARLIGAEIELASRPGHGSRFSVTLPRATPPRASNPALAATPAHGLAKSFIVVLEDDPAVRESLCGLLSTWSCRVAAAHSFAGAREILGAQPDLPAMLISSDHGPQIRAAARAIDAVFIAKPVAPSKLRASLAHLLTPKAAHPAEPSLSSAASR
jgi:CheY-like chemotaxis protein